MSDVSSIAAASVNLSLAQVQQQASLAVTKKAMDFQETAASAMIDGLKQAVPSFGHKLDVRA